MVGKLFTSTVISSQCKQVLFSWAKHNCSRRVSFYYQKNYPILRKGVKYGNNFSLLSPLGSPLKSSRLNYKTFLNQNVQLSCPTSYFSSVSNQKENVPNPSLPQKIVNRFPPHVQSYLKLSRVNQPIGTWLLFWPCTWGLSLGTIGVPEVSLLALFGLGAFIMRGAGCTVNDMWDRHIDRKVRRTADRPLASGELRMRHATAWLALQLSAAFTILLQLNYPCFIIGVGSLGLVTLYPLAKRVTYWPQAVLGMTFNIGVLMGFSAAVQHNQLGYLTLPWLDPSCIGLYLAGISWTLIYDTIYAHQDRNDDTVLGLGSTARRFGENTKVWLTGFGFLMISSLTASGLLADLAWPYYASITAVASHIVWQIKTLDINNWQNCSDRFKSNGHIGWIIFIGILASSVIKSSTTYSDTHTVTTPTNPTSTIDKRVNSIADLSNFEKTPSKTNLSVSKYSSLSNS